MKVGVVIPVGASGYPMRERALDMVRSYFATEFPDWTHCQSAVSRDPFPISKALNNGIYTCAANDCDRIVISWGDCLVLPSQLRQAVHEAGSSPSYVKAYDRFVRLTRDATERHTTYAGVLTGEVAAGDIELEGVGWGAGGVIVFRREQLAAIKGYDPRFVGWLGQDEAVELLMEAMTCVPPTRVRGDCLHLWHEPDPTAAGGNETQEANRALLARYERHRGDFTAMMAVREEAA